MSARPFIDFQPKSLRQRALDYLGKREYSYMELAQKLSKYAKQADVDSGEEFENKFTKEKFAEETEKKSDEITEILDDFKARGWLSDKRFTEMLVHARKTKFGSARVANELREKGVADELIASAIAEVKLTELDNARNVWQKKYKASAETREEWAKQARFLQSRGFDFDVIKKVLSHTDAAD